jgi:hypothetical protein
MFIGSPYAGMVQESRLEGPVFPGAIPKPLRVTMSLAARPRLR